MTARRSRLRQSLEVCVFVYRAYELKTGDSSLAGSEHYADYRTYLLSWAECALQLGSYCRELGVADPAKGVVAGLQEWLSRTAQPVDQAFPENKQLTIST